MRGSRVFRACSLLCLERSIWIRGNKMGGLGSTSLRLYRWTRISWRWLWIRWRRFWRRYRLMRLKTSASKMKKNKCLGQWKRVLVRLKRTRGWRCYLSRILRSGILSETDTDLTNRIGQKKNFSVDSPSSEWIRRQGSARQSKLNSRNSHRKKNWDQVS